MDKKGKLIFSAKLQFLYVAVTNYGNTACYGKSFGDLTSLHVNLNGGQMGSTYGKWVHGVY